LVRQNASRAQCTFTKISLVQTNASLAIITALLAKCTQAALAVALEVVCCATQANTARPLGWTLVQIAQQASIMTSKANLPHVRIASKASTTI
jgi:hypothetical protein